MYFKTVLFDFDVTLIDTSEGILKSLECAFVENDREVPSEHFLRKFIGPPLRSSFIEYCGMDEDETKAMIASFKRVYGETGLFDSKVYDGIIKLVKNLNDCGVNTGIVSLKPRVMIDRLVKHFGMEDLFSYIYGTIYDGDSDKSTVIREAADYFKTGTSDTLMVGDRMYDIDGAHKAGFKCAGAVYGCGTKEELVEHNADYLLYAPTDLEQIVRTGKED